MRRVGAAAAVAAAAMLAACGAFDDDDDDGGGGPAFNALPAGVTVQSVTTYADTGAGNGATAATQDLFTAGLGRTGLAGPPPGFADPANPTVAELRRRAVHTNYRAILDITAAGGYGTLYGPNVTAEGTVTGSEGKIAGTEYIATADDGTGAQNVVLMVQVPDTFDTARPCIVTAPSSGSRGVYGAIGSAGEWGLKRGCAVAYTDAGKGTGYHDLMADQVNVVDGRLVSRAAAGTQAHFAADLTDAERAAFNAAFPDRIAYKHIHSQQNPERNWGRNVLDSLRLAFWAVNEQFPTTDPATGRNLRRIAPENTIVIASSVSNGGAESLQAAEQDAEGLIDGVAVAEPNAQPASMQGVTVNFAGAPVANAGKPLIDYFTFRMIYEPCAAISANAQAANGIRPGWLGFGTAPLGTALTQAGGVELQTIAANRCQSLADKGLVAGTTTAAQADDALARMRDYGWNDPGIDALHASHYRLADIYVAFGYVNAHGRFSVADNVCGFSLANVDAAGNVAPQAATKTQLFATSNGLNTGGDVIYNDSVGGARLYHLGVSPSTGRIDAALDGMLCLRDLVTGVDTVTGAPLAGDALAASQRVQAGIREVLLTGDLRGKPAAIVHGRSDTLVPVNHASRAYVAFNARVEGASSNVRYYEIVNGQHFDAFLPNAAAGGVQGYDALFVPVHHYFIQAMDLMWARLTAGTALPPSQVVRATPRGGTPGAAPAITLANLPPIAAAPGASEAIDVGAGTIDVPQ
ncbi:MAG TPA: 3-hydroxybutyrate oligomer hydrolase family protein [Albitalea sp.]